MDRNAGGSHSELNTGGFTSGDRPSQSATKGYRLRNNVLLPLRPEL
jgi:hypothetical protein